MTLKRREFLYFLGASAGAIALKACGQETFSMPFSPPNSDSVNKISFKPVRVPMPLALDDMAAAEQKSVYSTYEVVDDLSLPESFTYDLIAAWGDKIGNSRFGYNNDYLSFIATNPDGRVFDD
ncbi:MAG: hypothetical protein HC775_01530 [Hyellaceae cyanobacterium CSU_1_1]|nr:hypothetical protein [Hyellaceae cyanobacterium CSU_1_1]